MNYIHLTIEERACISKFKEMGLSLREMAKLLNRNVSTITIEMKILNQINFLRFLLYIVGLI